MKRLSSKALAKNHLRAQSHLVISDFITEFLAEWLNLQNVLSLPFAEHSKPAAASPEAMGAGE